MPQYVNAVLSSKGHVENWQKPGTTICGRKVWRQDTPPAYFQVCRVCEPKKDAAKAAAPKSSPLPWKVIKSYRPSVDRKAPEEQSRYILSADGKAVTDPKDVSWPVRAEDGARIEADHALIVRRVNEGPQKDLAIKSLREQLQIAINFLGALDDEGMDQYIDKMNSTLKLAQRIK